MNDIRDGRRDPHGYFRVRDTTRGVVALTEYLACDLKNIFQNDATSCIDVHPKLSLGNDSSARSSGTQNRIQDPAGSLRSHQRDIDRSERRFHCVVQRRRKSSSMACTVEKKIII